MSTDDPAPIPQSTMRRDIVSAYVAAGARVLSVAIVSAVLLRRTHEVYFAVFVIVRAMVGLSSYFFAGVAPALQRALATATVQPFGRDPSEAAGSVPVLAYGRSRRSIDAIVYGNALSLGGVAAIACFALLLIYSNSFIDIHGELVTRYWLLAPFVLRFGLGQLFRNLSEIPAAALQVRGHIALDNCMVAIAELGWASLSVAAIGREYAQTFAAVASLYLASGFLLMLLRLIAVRVLGLREWFADLPPSWRITRELLGFGLLVVAAQVADFLYGPFATLLAQHFLGAQAVADYAPALQIDSAMLLTVGAISTVLLPKTATAQARGDIPLVRRYYIRGTFASAAILAFTAVIVLGLAPVIFTLWLGNTKPATRALLPFILIHTVVGGSAMVGRSILLGMGKVKPFTISVLIAGVSNVILSYVFVRYLHLGLNGIIYGTIVAVVGRCAIWMPWYVLRTLRSSSN